MFSEDDIKGMMAQAQKPAATAGAFSEDDVKAMMAQAAPQPEQPGRAEALARGAAQGLTLGFGDEITGAAMGAYDRVFGDATDISEAYAKHRDEARAANDAAKQAHGGFYLGGELAGGLAGMAIPGGGLAKLGGAASKLVGGSKLAGVMAEGAALGGASGLGNSTADSASGVLKDMGTGAMMGGGLGAAGFGLAAGAKALPSALKSAANNRAFAALKPSAQVGEDAQAIGRAALDAGAFGKTGFTGIKGIAQNLEKSAAVEGASPELVRAAGIARGAAGEPAQKLLSKDDLMLGLGASVLTGGLSTKALATVAAKRVAEKYGNQVAAKTLDAGAKVTQRLMDAIQSAPQSLGKYAPVLQKAAQRGPQALSAAHFVMASRDPEYRKISEQLNDDSFMPTAAQLQGG